MSIPLSEPPKRTLSEPPKWTLSEPPERTLSEAPKRTLSEAPKRSTKTLGETTQSPRWTHFPPQDTKIPEKEDLPLTHFQVHLHYLFSCDEFSTKILFPFHLNFLIFISNFKY